MRMGLSIAARICIIFIIVIFILITATGAILYVNMHDILRTNVIKDLTQMSRQIKFNTDAIINGIDQATMQLYTDVTIIDALSGDDLSRSGINKTVNIINQQLYNLPLNNVLPAYYIELFLDKEVSLASGIPPSGVITSGVYNNGNAVDKVWYKNAVKNDGAIYWSPTEEQGSGKSPYLRVSRLVKNALPAKKIRTSTDGAGILGVVSVSFHQDYIGDILKEARLTSNSEIYFISEYGDVLYTTSSEAVGSNIPEDALSGFVNAYDKTGTYVEQYDGRGYLINSLMLRGGCRLLTVVPMSDISGKIAVIGKIVVIAVVLSLAVGIVLTFFISLGITRPIRRLSRAMAQIQDQESLGMSLKITSNDEIGLLYKSFNRMMTRISKLLGEVYESGRKEREAEIKALEAEINPHFLYNTLDSVNWMALSRGEGDIAHIVSTLSEILRYSIKNNSQLVTIKEEMIQLDHYIDIQKKCFSDAFEVFYNLGEGFEDNMIPKLVLQPLVENAIMHGISKSKHRGYIKIEGYIEAQKIILTVENSGPQINVENINGIIRDDCSDDLREHHGIRNVDQRIKLHFGETYGLHYEEGTPGGVKAVIELPYDEVMRTRR